MAYQSSENLRTIDGHEIILHIFTPTQTSYAQSKCTGVVLAVHGLAEHTGRYHELANVTCAQGKVFAMFDLREHGTHAATPPLLQNLSSYVLDIVFAWHSLKKFFPQVESQHFGLLGHSLGGMFVTYAASILKDDVKKVFLSAPGFAHKLQVPAWKVLFARMLGHIFPALKIPVKIDPNQLSNNTVNNDNYSKDPLVLKSFSLQLGNMMLDSMDEHKIQASLIHISAEVTLLLPMDDKITDNEVAKKLLPSFGGKTILHELPQAGHESFNEIPKVQQVAFSHYENWLNSL